MPERAGEVETVDETKHIEWRISDIFVKENFLYESPLFPSTDQSWKLFLSQCTNGDIAIAIWTSKKREYSLRYCFGLKKCDGSIKKKVSGILESDKSCCLWSLFIEKDELFRRKTELAPSNILAVTCTLKKMTEVSHLADPVVLDKAQPLKSTIKLGLAAIFYFSPGKKPNPFYFSERAGDIETAYETKQIEWKISDIFAKEYFMYESPLFSTTDHSWNLLLRQSSDGIIAIAIWTDTKRKYLLRYCFGLKKWDGSEEKKISGILESDKCCCLWSSFIKKEELLQEKTELAPSNTLTVTCTLKRTTETSHSAEPIVLDKTKPLKLISKI